MPQVHRRFDNNHQAHTSKERHPSQRDTNQDKCTKCGDSLQVEGFAYPASRYQCKNCHKFGHFSSLCYIKNEFERSLEPRSPKVHQLKIGSVCTKDSLCSQLEDTSSDDSFSLQMKLKSTQAETKLPVPQHLKTNLAFKLKPQKKTQYLRARTDTCADVNILPVSMYKLIFKVTDCKMLASNSKEIGTYTTEKIPVIGSCTLLTEHLESQDFQEVTFHITSQESSVVLSCMTALALGLIQPHEKLDFKPSSASLISNKLITQRSSRKKYQSQGRIDVQAKNNLLLYYLQKRLPG